MPDELPSITEPWPAEPPPPPRPPYSTGGYLAESFGAFFGDPTWWKKTLVGGLATLVPIVGTIAVEGYSLTWMRETAWGVDRGLPKTDDIGSVLTTGGRAFVVQLLWSLIILVALIVLVGAAVVGGILWSESNLDALAIVGGVIALLLYVGVAVFAGILAAVGAVRATIYERISAGASIDGVRSLLRRHSVGFWNAFGTSILAGCAAVAFNFLQMGVVTLTQSGAPAVVVAGTVFSWAMLPVIGAASFVAAMIRGRAYGRWVREIDPRTLPPLDTVTATATPGADTPPPSNDPFSDAGDVAP